MDYCEDKITGDGWLQIPGARRSDMSKAIAEYVAYTERAAN